jgi:hypothetical protein
VLLQVNKRIDIDALAKMGALAQWMINTIDRKCGLFIRGPPMRHSHDRQGLHHDDQGNPGKTIYILYTSSSMPADFACAVGTTRPNCSQEDYNEEEIEVLRTHVQLWKHNWYTYRLEQFSHIGTHIGTITYTRKYRAMFNALDHHYRNKVPDLVTSAPNQSAPNQMRRLTETLVTTCNLPLEKSTH